MKILYPLFLLSLIFAACSSNESKSKSRAVTAGKEHAVLLSSRQPMTEMELQNFLFEIKNNESRLRAMGFDEAADKYIQTFKESLEIESDSLYRIVFDGEDSQKNSSN